MKQIIIYSFKLWFSAAAISLVLFQAPLFYMQHFDVHIFNAAYGHIWWLFFVGWLQTMFVLFFSSFLALSLVSSSYGLRWSAVRFKTVLHLFSQVLMLLSLGVFFAISKAQFVVPTPVIFLIFVISYAIAVQLINYKHMLEDLHADRMSFE